MVRRFYGVQDTVAGVLQDSMGWYNYDGRLQKSQNGAILEPSVTAQKD
jgi:hypothetical protein